MSTFKCKPRRFTSCACVNTWPFNVTGGQSPFLSVHGTSINLDSLGVALRLDSQSFIADRSYCKFDYALLDFVVLLRLLCHRQM